MQKNKFLRRIASNDVTLDGKLLGLYIVEFDSLGIVRKYYPLVEEQPFTEWMSEPLTLITDSAGLVKISK